MCVVWFDPQLLLHLQARGTSLVLLLPERGEDSREDLVQLAPRVPRLVAQLPPTEMEVLLPQLAAVSRAKDLRPALRALGVHTALDSSLRQYVGSLTQDAFVSTSFVAINSVSSVGARLGECSGLLALLASTMDCLSTRRCLCVAAERSRRQATPRLVLNRPFLFFVVHDGELIMLAGKVNSPAQVPKGLV